jgi:5-(carboxyamino)imidazole ribonucleotide synthase
VTAPILPGAEIGVLGGGQLGRMFTFAAARLGYRVAVLAPDDDTPAGQVSCREIRAPYEDLETVGRFARSVSVITFEFENVPEATTDAAAQYCPVRPAGSVLATTQDRIQEKAALRRLGIPLPKYAVIERDTDVAAAAVTFPGKSVLKTARWGYDGKGQRTVASGAGIAAAWKTLNSARAVVEEYVPFRGEISVVGVRGVDGAIALYEPVANRHANHILDVSIYPAPVSTSTRNAAHEIARAVLEGLQVIGVLCVEMFELQDGSLVVNEIAPRPHNSGHLTIDAHVCSQFEQQVRAVCGLPLGSTAAHARAAAMANLLGDVWSKGEPDWSAALATPGLQLHLYGKEDPQIGRKMGHMTVPGADSATAERVVLASREALASHGSPAWTPR